MQKIVFASIGILFGKKATKCKHKHSIFLLRENDFAPYHDATF